MKLVRNLGQIIILLIIICHAESQWDLSCKGDKTKSDKYLMMKEVQLIRCNITGQHDGRDYWLAAVSKDEHVVNVNDMILLVKDGELSNHAEFNITGNFLGKTNITISLQTSNITTSATIVATTNIPVVVIRETRIINTVFHVSVILLVSIMYVNFGAAVKMDEVRSMLRKPIGPLIGIFGQFVLMPVISFFVGRAIFPDSPAMQLGMFFTGVSPGGGASNMWTVILNGNIDLSIAMTTVSTIGAYGMMPAWLFTLGKVIFDDADIAVPYTMISEYVALLIIPLATGYAIRRFFPRVGAFLVRILKGLSSLLILFIVVFAIVTNLYLFKLFSWRLILAGLGLPWLGYATAWLLAICARQSAKDALTIAIETGIQNTGIAILMLRSTLSQPEADLTTIVPVAVAIMIPIPLFLLYVVQKLRERFCSSANRNSADKDSDSISNDGGVLNSGSLNA